MLLDLLLTTDVIQAITTMLGAWAIILPLEYVKTYPVLFLLIYYTPLFFNI